MSEKKIKKRKILGDNTDISVSKKKKNSMNDVESILKPKSKTDSKITKGKVEDKATGRSSSKKDISKSKNRNSESANGKSTSDKDVSKIKKKKRANDLQKSTSNDEKASSYGHPKQINSSLDTLTGKEKRPGDDEKMMDYKQFRLQKMKTKLKNKKRQGQKKEIKSILPKEKNVDGGLKSIEKDEESKKFGICDFSELLYYWNQFAAFTLTSVEREEIKLEAKNVVTNSKLRAPHKFFTERIPHWNEFLKRDIPNGSPLIIVVCPSAIRVTELNRLLKPFQGKACRTIKLIKKEKFKDQVELISNKSFHMVIGTPHRIDLFLSQENLKLDECRVIALDWSYEDVKKRRLITIPEIIDQGTENNMASSTKSTLSPLSTSIGSPANGPSSPSMIFCEELDFNELQLLQVVGRGTFGTVKRAIWREKMVAVKIIEGESARKTFAVEVSKLARVKHKNIITLYGICTKEPVCLIMEFAEGGSLHRVLHKHPKPAYKAAHAISWMLQCAEGVEYLHSRKPKALVHRDLKPLNLLLFDSGRKLKICDFGTACDLHTHMTNNKGSAQWMAPEVFEGSKYSEKCDVFSWGIMLWEVLTRRTPFAEIDGNAWRLMWAVHSGQRPPLIQNCPKPIEILMTRCWSTSPDERPSMSEAVQIMTRLMPFFDGADQPLIYDASVEYVEETVDDDELDYFDPTMSVIPPATVLVESDGGTPILTLPQISGNLLENLSAQQTTPASFGGSVGDITSLVRNIPVNDKSSNAVESARGHRRTHSCDFVPGLKLSSTDGTTNADGLSSDEYQLNVPYVASAPVFSDAGHNASEDIPKDAQGSYLALDAQFQPLRPYPGSGESEAIYREHCLLAEEYIKIQEEITLLLKKKQDLIMELNNHIKEAHQSNRYQQYQQLLLEKDKMEKLFNTLKDDLEAARKRKM